MKTYSITTYTTGKTIYSGQHASFSACLEKAIHQELDLSYADLRYKNLSSGNFDSAHMPHANFSGANLTGANLSEANLKGSLFDQTDLYNTCLCYSNISYCDFINSNFGATDIGGADISHSVFSTLSCFDLDFMTAENMEGCMYINTNKERCAMNYHPLIIKGIFTSPIVIFDTTIKIGNNIFEKNVIPLLINTLENIANSSTLNASPYTKELHKYFA